MGKVSPSLALILRRADRRLKKTIDEKFKLLYQTKRCGSYLFEFHDGKVGAFRLDVYGMDPKNCVLRLSDYATGCMRDWPTYGEAYVPYGDSPPKRVRGKPLAMGKDTYGRMEVTFTPEETERVVDWVVDNYRTIFSVPGWMCNKTRKWMKEMLEKGRHPGGSDDDAHLNGHYIWTKAAADSADRLYEGKRVRRYFHH